LTEHYDLYVRIAQTKSWASLQEYAVVARHLKLTGLGIDASSLYFSPEKGIFTFQKAGLRFFLRLTIKANKIPQIKRILAKNRQRALIIAVETDELNVCKWAAHDPRVDLITIDPTCMKVDKGLANLLKMHQKPAELIYAPLLRVSGSHRSKLLRTYYKILNLILRKRIKLVVSSGATSVFDLRGKREAVAIAIQLGLPKATAQVAVSEIPAQIIQERLEEINQNL